MSKRKTGTAVWDEVASSSQSWVEDGWKRARNLVKSGGFSPVNVQRKSTERLDIVENNSWNMRRRCDTLYTRAARRGPIDLAHMDGSFGNPRRPGLEAAPVALVTQASTGSEPAARLSDLTGSTNGHVDSQDVKGEAKAQRRTSKRPYVMTGSISSPPGDGIW
ncbi:hypothetical protein CC1G_14186 [Coprinopsis cinerea okayama7|uniref:Uncharacterized protein n=1 Tax=Coprinopsis cinerea (strain Okayama-7 / 130 / ATCC MYA-4618 / FGSC 9003) TaxID=240176 RepID=D6RLD2_COPC7|nr:hypothetical protein CC1G_14186 [Coprinopsis cinerea okayama7\|eukprot:XP_002911653.1 hypothetical protein CC1G_14186 [Coprinopsis cinerea okayama7\